MSLLPDALVIGFTMDGPLTFHPDPIEAEYARRHVERHAIDPSDLEYLLNALGL